MTTLKRLLLAASMCCSVATANATPVDDANAAYGRGDYAQALKITRPLAAQGNALAQYRIGFMYYNGKGVTQSYQEALKWFRLAAAQGHAHAQLGIGVMYAESQGVTQNYQEAVKWYRLAAAQGNALAQNNIGWMYRNGDGVIKNDQEALKWFRLAADQGHATAIANLKLPEMVEAAQNSPTEIPQRMANKPAKGKSSPPQLTFSSPTPKSDGTVGEPDSVNRVQSGTQNQEKLLLSEAISLIQNLSPDLASKDRLKIYENALQKFDTIIDEYGHTDTGLTLKSTGRFGNFDYNEIQQRYGAELTSFYMKTCEVSPSAICQGFVSLKDGVDSCKTANSFNELRTAHLNIINSMIIFGEQEKNPGLYKNAKMNYYACKKRAGDVDEDAARDYFNYQLVKTILPMNDGGSARGLVENMKNPFYKFASVIELKKYSGEIVDTAYISRMMKYIDDTMPEQRGADINYLRVSSILSLLNIAHLPESKFRLNIYEYGERNSLSNKLRFKLIAVQNSSGRDVMLRTNSCQDPIFSREIFDSSFEYLDKLYTSYNQNPAMTFIRSNNIKYFIEADFASRTGDGDSFEVPIFNGCSEKYSIALSAISALFYENKPNEARKYYLQFTNGNFSNDKLKLIDEYLTLSSFNNNYGRRATDDMTKESLFKMPFMMTGQDGNFSLFKKYVDNNLICEASSVLFKEMKNSKHTVSARSYLTAKNKLARGNKIKCGDEDLELLLR